MQVGDEKLYDALALDLAKNFALDTQKAIINVDNFFEQLEKKLSSRAKSFSVILS